VTAPALALHRELARKALHLLSASAPVAYAAQAPRVILTWILAAAAVVAIAVEVTRRRMPTVQRVLDRVAGNLFRPHEHAGVTGATWLILALLVAIAVLPRPEAIATMWAAAVGDPVAALVGRSMGRIRLHPDGKSLEGSLACLATTALGAWLIAGLPAIVALLAGLAAAIAEWPRRPLDDNIRITAVTGATLVALRMFSVS
jgi:dolichol kinase